MMKYFLHRGWKEYLPTVKSKEIFEDEILHLSVGSKIETVLL